jgi:hypothetical protein
VANVEVSPINSVRLVLFGLGILAGTTTLAPGSSLGDLLKIKNVFVDLTFPF